MLIFSGVFTCTVTSISLLIHLGADPGNIPGTLFTEYSTDCKGLFLFAWAWSYAKLIPLTLRLKRIDYFLFVSLVLLPPTLSVFFDLVLAYSVRINMAIPTLFFLVELAAAALSTHHIGKRALSNPEIPQEGRAASSLQSSLYRYTSLCYYLVVFLVSSNPTMDPLLFSFLVLLVSLKAAIGAAVVTTITSSLRTGSIEDLRGSLANFRFLKKAYNTLIFLIILFVSMAVILLSP